MDHRPGPPAAVVVGASAGGVEALTAFVRGLPADLPAAVLVVLHLPAHGRSRLVSILARAGTLPVDAARSGEPLRAGRVVVAAPDRHLLVHGDAVLLSAGAEENGSRPAVDPLFRSAARWLGPRVVAVVLSGMLDDGAAGAASVAAQGGRVVVQDPEQALFDPMPSAALRAAPGALVLPAEAIGARLPALLAATAGQPLGDVPDDLRWATDVAERDEAAVSGTGSPGRRVGVSCPGCHGAVTEVRVGAAVTYRCHVGHAYGPESMLHAQAEATETALWTAVASLEEQAAVRRELAVRAAGPDERDEHLRRAEEAATRARDLRRELRSSASAPPGPAGARPA